MTNVGLDDFCSEKECVYKEEHYSVRDNGAVCRHVRNGMRKRPLDNQWTFGKGNKNNPYLLVANIRVHRIVATAFHGEPSDPNYVVDHIDSNCRNNRPENLRWLTRLENALKNPATRKKIEYHCGSIEAFLKNPSILNNLQDDPNFVWMRRVTTEEAQNCMDRMTLWVNKRTAQTSSSSIGYKKSFEKRVFQPLQKWEAGLAGEPGLDFALTRWCGQYMWGADVYFPCCPKSFGNDPLNDYYKNLKEGDVFAYNDEDEFPKLTVSKSEFLEENSSILVMCERADNNWAIVGITLNEKLHFIHFNIGSYSEINGVEEAFISKKSLKDFWSEGYGQSWDLK